MGTQWFAVSLEFGEFGLVVPCQSEWFRCQDRVRSVGSLSGQSLSDSMASSRGSLGKLKDRIIVPGGMAVQLSTQEKPIARANQAPRLSL
jgi:hypothetical protein